MSEVVQRQQEEKCSGSWPEPQKERGPLTNLLRISTPLLTPPPHTEMESWFAQPAAETKCGPCFLLCSSQLWSRTTHGEWLHTSGQFLAPIIRHLECVAHRHDRDIQTETALLRRGQGEVARTLMLQPGMETPLDVLSRAASLVHADDEKREAALRGEPRLQTLPVASALTAHRTGPPPISPSKRKFSVDPGDDDLDCDGDHASKMSRTFAPHLNKTANGDCRKDPRERSRSPIERAVAPTMSLHGGPLYASLPSLSMEQPLALTKNSLDAGRPAGLSPTLAPVERQQNRPSVITCASASARNCNLSHCPVAHSGCAAGPASYRRTPSSTCDPVVEEHFRRSLGKNYKEPEPAPNSVSITGSVDDHFAKALGDTWLQIKAAKDGASSSPESASRRGQPASPSAHMVSHGHSPSVVS
ncbi:hypothetical protein MJG53_016133 [Ovis ammon polii x Ovis aries]|uniref:Uncharacterized protein n=1 Tax=Ovis ammon polii x Ovis aries TaxID=2918886 RepID=A0ACB9UAK0_9CETA|nr:hypothetical protein MJG53_016133 [Ovis ammon polii x Ovis aries]